MSVDNFAQLKSQFIFDIKSIVEMEEIPSDLIINWDQTGIKYMPVSNWIIADEGSKWVEVVGADDKRQITTAITLSGDFLHPQLTYKGTTSKCLPSVHFPVGWDVTFSENDWSNEGTMVSYLDKVLIPYIARTRIKNQLDGTYPALVIYDTLVHRKNS